MIVDLQYNSYKLEQHLYNLNNLITEHTFTKVVIPYGEYPNSLHTT